MRKTGDPFGSPVLVLSCLRGRFVRIHLNPVGYAGEVEVFDPFSFFDFLGYLGRLRSGIPLLNRVVADYADRIAVLLGRNILSAPGNGVFPRIPLFVENPPAVGIEIDFGIGLLEIGLDLFSDPLVSQMGGLGIQADGGPVRGVL